MGLSLLHVRSSLTILLSTDICLTCSGTPQPPRQFILGLHCSLSPWHTRQEVFNSQLGRVRSDIEKSFLTEKPDSFFFSVVFYDLTDWYVSVFSRLNVPSLLSLSPEIMLSRTYCYSLYFLFRTRRFCGIQNQMQYITPAAVLSS